MIVSRSSRIGNLLEGLESSANILLIPVQTVFLGAPFVSGSCNRCALLALAKLNTDSTGLPFRACLSIHGNDHYAHKQLHAMWSDGFTERFGPAGLEMWPAVHA